MSSQEILERAVKLAIEGGWCFWEIGKDGWSKELELAYHLEALENHADAAEVYDTVNCIIFNHDFAKALWGVAPTDIKGFELQMPEWKRKLQQMVIADDPIKYLGENLPESK